MPRYRIPGVWMEETSFRARRIEGLSTSTAGFVGPTRCGPMDGEPELLASFADFERRYGGLDPGVTQSGKRAVHSTGQPNLSRIVLKFAA